MFNNLEEQMALALALSRFGAEHYGDAAPTPVAAWTWLRGGLVECGHAEDEAAHLIENEVRSQLHFVEAGQHDALKQGVRLLNRFAWMTGSDNLAVEG